MALTRHMKELMVIVLIAINFGLIGYHASLVTMCKEPELDSFTRLLVWMNLSHQQSQCPTREMAAWWFFINILRQFVILGLLFYIKPFLYKLYKRALYLVLKLRGRQDGIRRRKVSFHAYWNADAPFGEVMFRRVSDVDETTFSYNKDTHKFECVMWQPRV